MKVCRGMCPTGWSNIPPVPCVSSIELDSMIQDIFTFLTAFSASLFTGAALYVGLVEHPARMDCGTEIAVRVFPSSYRRAAVMQATLALLTFLFSIVAWLATGIVWWLVGGLLMVSVVPFTLLVIMPTNQALIALLPDKTHVDAEPLLRRWGRLHVIRTLLSLLSLLVFLLVLVLSPHHS
jgi:uncharacterized membrane protein